MNQVLFIRIMDEKKWIKAEYLLTGTTDVDVQRAFIKLVGKRRVFKKILTSPYTLLTPLAGNIPDGLINDTAETVYKNCKLCKLTKAETNLIMAKLGHIPTKQLSTNFFLSESTIKTHLYRIFKKLKVDNINDAMKKLQDKIFLTLCCMFSAVCSALASPNTEIVSQLVPIPISESELFLQILSSYT